MLRVRHTRELVIKLTDSDASANLPVDVNPLQIAIHYTFMELGKEVTHMFMVIAESKEQYNQWLHSAYPETA